MNKEQQSFENLQHIKNMMERSSRFISLSGLSGVAAGICALVGAYFANNKIQCWLLKKGCSYNAFLSVSNVGIINDLILIALITFIVAFCSAFLFTYLRSKKNNLPIWGSTTFRLFWNTIIPLFIGALFLLKLILVGEFEFIAPGCLIFYGLALVNASKYTLGEIRYLGYCQLILGALNLYFVSYGLYFWMLGFGVLHIIYGIAMWYKYERV